MQNMREKVNLLHTIKKKDIRFMKRVGQKKDVKDDEPVVYKSKLEEQLARKREAQSPGMERQQLVRFDKSPGKSNASKSNASPKSRKKSGGTSNFAVTPNMLSTQNSPKSTKKRESISPKLDLAKN